MLVVLLSFLASVLLLCAGEYYTFFPSLWDEDKDYYCGIKYRPEHYSRYEGMFFSVETFSQYNAVSQHLTSVKIYNQKIKEINELRSKRLDLSFIIPAMIIFCASCATQKFLWNPFIRVSISFVVFLVILGVVDKVFPYLNIKNYDFSTDLSLETLIKHFPESQYEKVVEALGTNEEDYPAFFYFVTEVRAKWLDYYCKEIYARQSVCKAVEEVTVVLYLLLVPVCV